MYFYPRKIFINKFYIMKYLQNTATWLIALFLIVFSGCNQKPAGEHTFAIGDKTFLLDGKPFVIKAAEIHYTRIPAEYWHLCILEHP